MHHELKLQMMYWNAKVSHQKPWEIRETKDRSFHLDDTVDFYQVTDDEGHMPTGKRYGPVRIMYLLFPAAGNIIPAGTCAFTHTQA
jgi:hypothetical protein